MTVWSLPCLVALEWVSDSAEPSAHRMVIRIRQLGSPACQAERISLIRQCASRRDTAALKLLNTFKLPLDLNVIRFR
ncbi:uncharacterized protein L969DRAFT_560793 [Mixia osmundae IAM 14324]|uniref:uncharacterized protein n=1 Tax=Mixia osmundae (strain CBS 9802 / IAM 14324 / JCM 22182 / KY 12970) TaxID=764103 RepID=UPI0004A55257|nr:uncharacterized protein L969DRAFT_560793 [Mixia osmundae IAM 14324]KEI38000.1 hypothetical protein L969DRAFT_560793 [Mixia osmundae IAM 14324]